MPRQLATVLFTFLPFFLCSFGILLLVKNKRIFCHVLEFIIVISGGIGLINMANSAEREINKINAESSYEHIKNTFPNIGLYISIIADDYRQIAYYPKVSRPDSLLFVKAVDRCDQAIRELKPWMKLKDVKTIYSLCSDSLSLSRFPKTAIRSLKNHLSCLKWHLNILEGGIEDRENVNKPIEGTDLERWIVIISPILFSIVLALSLVRIMASVFKYDK